MFELFMQCLLSGFGWGIGIGVGLISSALIWIPIRDRVNEKSNRKIEDYNERSIDELKRRNVIGDEQGHYIAQIAQSLEKISSS